MATQTSILANYEYLRTYLNNILKANVTYIESRQIKDKTVIYFISETNCVANNGMITFEGYDIYATLFKGQSSTDIIDRKYIETRIFNAIKPYDMTDINSELKVLNAIKKEYSLLVESNRVFGDYFLAIRDCYKMACENMRSNGMSNCYYDCKVDRTSKYTMRDVCCVGDTEVQYVREVIFYKGVDCTLTFSGILN